MKLERIPAPTPIRPPDLFKIEMTQGQARLLLAMGNISIGIDRFVVATYASNGVTNAELAPKSGEIELLLREFWSLLSRQAIG